eukprot:4957127-Lingulodinium_polyedra.AAC.1
MAQPLTQSWSANTVRAPVTLQPLTQPLSGFAGCPTAEVWPARPSVAPGSKSVPAWRPSLLSTLARELYAEP